MFIALSIFELNLKFISFSLKIFFYYFSQCLGSKTTGTIILLKEEIFQALPFLLFFLFKHPGFVHSSKNQLNYNSPSDSDLSSCRDVGGLSAHINSVRQWYHWLNCDP